MKKVTPSRLVPNTHYQITHNGLVSKAVFVGTKMEGMDRLYDVKFQSAANGHRWIFSAEGKTIEFKKGWTQSGKGCLVPADDSCGELGIFSS